jgi:hypothetical protein
MVSSTNTFDSMIKRKAILIYTSFSTFVREDYQILSSEYEVTKYHFIALKSVCKLLNSLFKQFFFCLFYLKRYELIFIWFADYHAAIPIFFGKLFSKKTVIVIGGYDAVYIPSIDYGVFKPKTIRSIFSRYSLRNTSHILPVDQCLVSSINSFAGLVEKGYKVGVSNFVNGIKGQIEVVPTGYDPSIWERDKSVIRRLSVITIAAVYEEKTFKVKGIDFLLEIAKLMPKTTFSIVGLGGSMLEFVKLEAPHNVKFHGFVQHHNLPTLLSEHKVYTQLSLSEGLPNALCEAMLCECIPVGSSVGGIPKGIGKAGFILQKKDVNEAVRLIQLALDSDESLGKLARQHIVDNFPFDLRKNRILSILNSD